MSVAFVCWLSEAVNVPTWDSLWDLPFRWLWRCCFNLYGIFTLLDAAR
jgi:hypothetical protein